MTGGLRFDSGKPEPVLKLKNGYSTDTGFKKFVDAEQAKYAQLHREVDAKNYVIDETYLDSFSPALIDITRLCYYGAAIKGYGRDNWKLGMSWSKVMNSLLRHIIRFWIFKENLDPETGLPHTTAIAWNALALSTYFLEGIGKDDR